MSVKKSLQVLGYKVGPSCEFTPIGGGDEPQPYLPRPCMVFGLAIVFPANWPHCVLKTAGNLALWVVEDDGMSVYATHARMVITSSDDGEQGREVVWERNWIEIASLEKTCGGDWPPDNGSAVLEALMNAAVGIDEELTRLKALAAKHLACRGA